MAGNTCFCSGGFTYTPPGGGDGSKWYAPSTGAPAVLPVASGTDALAAGNGAVASGANAIAFGTNVNIDSGVGIGQSITFSGGYVAVGLNITCTSTSIAIGEAVSATSDGVAYGRSVTCSGNGAAAMGHHVIASASGAVAYGTGDTWATAVGAVALGREARASAVGAFAGGLSASASAQGAIAIGYGVTASHHNAVALAQNIATLNPSEITRSDDVGGALKGRTFTPLVPRTTTDGAANNFAGLAIPNNGAAAFHGRCAAYRTAGAGVIGDSASWDINGLVKQVGGTYTLVGIAVGTAGVPTFNDAGAATWTLAGAIVGNLLVFTATGQVGETIQWEIAVEFVATA